MADEDFNIKEILRNSVVKQKINTLKDYYDESLFTLALSLSAAVKKMFFEKSERKFSAEPLLEKKLIIHFLDRMRIDGLEKFNNPAVFSVIHLYASSKDLEKRINPLGVLIVYVEKTYLPELLRHLKYPYVEYDDDDEVKDGCGAICNLIAGSWKREISNLGYIDLEISYFESYINTNINGIEFPKDQTHKYEISFDIDEKKRIVLEMVMGMVPRREITDDEEN